MMVQIDLWQLITGLAFLFVSFISFASLSGKFMLTQIDKRMNERFLAAENARKESQKHLDERFATVLAQSAEDAKEWRNLEKSFLKFQAELPNQYVRREDYIRNQTVIEAKLDSVALRIENLQLKGAASNGG